MTTSALDIQQLSINTIRTLSMDAVQKADSGHPGTPMALAPVVFTLWTKHLKYDPLHPNWVARDRFVLSCGHASMLLYSVLHLAGVKALDKQGNPTSEPAISLNDIRNFRQLNSPCAGHPEYGAAAGIETTTGPLGQGVANSVGMAIASKWLSSRYDRDGFDLFGYNVYAQCSDGDLMEGISNEAASLAGHLQLANLCWIYDDNKITIEGSTDLAFSENVGGRFESLGWQVIRVADVNDLDALDAAFDKFKQTHDRPTLIIVRSVIGYGAPHKAGSHDAHGAPLGEEEVKGAKEFYGWDPTKSFFVPSEVVEHFDQSIGQAGSSAYLDWSRKHDEFKKRFAVEAGELKTLFARELPDGWESALPVFSADAKGMATRSSSGKVLNALAGKIPWLIGGSADLAGSNKSRIDDAQAGDFGAKNYGGRNFHFGIREHAMASICNGMSLSGIRAYGATFFVFTDYLRPALRLGCIMHQPVLYILTHDSIGLGEDGPTHQPVEHLAACRAIPRLLVMRPGDANEVSVAYRAALNHKHQPTALVLTRQNCPTLDRSKYASADGVMKGAYVLLDSAGTPDVILMGTGSELGLCVEAAEQLTQQGIQTRIVSMPCWKLFDAQPDSYREDVLPSAVTARVAVEAGIKQGWEKYLGKTGKFIGMTGFGASAPFEELYQHFGITTQAVVAAAIELVKK